MPPKGKTARRVVKRTTSAPASVSQLAAPQVPTGVLLSKDSPCSLEFSRDAKGVARWALKLYGDLDEMDQLVAEAHRLDAILREHEQETDDGQ